MHNNYFFLRNLTPLLENRLKDSVVSECFSQNKDELIIRFETRFGPFLIKASLSPSFSCLSFPENFHRARKNSVDLFDNLIGQHVEGIRQFKNERSFAIQFGNNFSLLFKLHGNRSNIILFRGEDVDRLFKNDIQGDLGLKFATLDRQIDWTFENFLSHQSELQSIYFTFGKLVWKYLADRNFYAQTTEQQWNSIQELLQRLNNSTYYISDTGEKLTFSLLPLDKVVREFQDPLKGLNDFYLSYTQHDTFAGEKSAALSALKLRIQSSENYYEKMTQKLSTIQTHDHYKTWADILMANLHDIEPGSERVMLPNFYNENQLTEIKLKKDLSPQKNAEVFYTKSKKQQQEINRLHQELTGKEKEIVVLKSQIQELETITDLKTLRSRVGSLGLINPREKQVESLPYHEFAYNGFKILVGRTAQGNDRLTLKYGYKEDLWLHAKDVAGSHVLIKYQSGKKFPKDVIERAAQLAAYNSKRKTDSLCPVVVTPRKFVRKRKGDPAGSVIVEREEVIMVEPKR